jgi:hypothetical protein
MRGFPAAAIAVALGAGAGCVPAGGGPEDAGTTDATPAPPPEPVVPEGLRGPFHLVPEPVDPTNLALYDGGTFAWSMNGCDFFGSDVGVWVPDQGGVVLSPAPGQTDFQWHVASPSIADPVVEVRLAPAPGGLRASVTALDGTVSEQSWELGGRCPICGGLGPTDTEPCEDPALPPAGADGA